MAASIDSPSAALAPCGSPSTPLDDIGLTPSARNRGRRTSRGSVRPATASSVAHDPRIDGQHQRGLGPPGVGVATADAGRPDEHRVAVGPAPLYDQRKPFVIAPVGGDQHDTGEGVPGGADQFHQEVGQHVMVDEQRPGERRVLATGSIGHGGCHDDIGTGPGEPGRHLHRDPGVRIEREVGTVLLE